MEIIDRINPAPKWEGVSPKPIFRTTLDRQRWWETEKQRWVEGYGEGYSKINGMLYFYLTQGHLKDGSDGTVIRPRYRDCDEWITDIIYDRFWNLNGHVMVCKRREIGMTSLGAGLLPAYTMRMFPSSTFGMTSCDQDRIGKAYYDKTMVMFDEMDADIKPNKDRSNETKSNIYVRYEWKTSQEGEEVLRYSDLFAKETNSSDRAGKGFSGTRMRAAYFDEFPLHSRKKLLLGSSQSCVMKGAFQSGLLVAAGTVEDGLTPEQISELRDIIADSKAMNFETIFAPAWWGLFMDENGISDEKKGREWWEKEYERLNNMNDKSFLNAFIKNYPMSLDQVFELAGGSRFDEVALDKVRQQIKINNQEKPPINGYRLYDRGFEVIAEPNKDSPVQILEHPKVDVKYKIGLDAVMTSELTQANTKSKQSYFAAIVCKEVDPQSDIQFVPVATMKWRPRTREEAERILCLLVKYYNQYGKARIMGELNAGGESVITMLNQMGLTNTIMHRKDISQKGFVETRKPWLYRNDTIRKWQQEALNVYYKNYTHMIKFNNLLDDALKSDDDNVDMEDAMMCVLYAWGTGHPLVQKVEVKKTIKMMMCEWDDTTKGYKWVEKTFTA